MNERQKLIQKVRQKGYFDDTAVLDSIETDHGVYLALKHRYRLSEPLLLSLISEACAIPFNTLSELMPNQALKNAYQHDPLFYRELIPLYENKDELAVATDNPFHPRIMSCKKKVGKPLRCVLVSKSDILKFWYSKCEDQSDNELFSLLRDAIQREASDIHFFSQSEGVIIKYRIHGTLFDHLSIDTAQARKLTSLIKVHAGMDISKMTQPQDGRITLVDNNQNVDTRVSSLPTLYGEDFVIRILGGQATQKTLASCGFSTPILTALRGLKHMSSGLILVTGPTGSGKSTTLYALLNDLKQDSKRNIVTLEDPIESVVPGVRQSQINARIGYGFPEALRAVLRQDPDCIMVGEIRDEKTCKSAIDAAYTGHLVLSTLHTQDVRSTLKRLMSFNCDPFLVLQSLNAIMSQKLVPHLCQQCCERSETEWVATGCQQCNFLGYHGRTVVSEYMTLEGVDSNKVSVKNFDDWIAQAPNFCSFEQDIRYKQARGMISGHLKKSAH